MNLAGHAAVLWRFRAVTLMGLLLGIVLAILASYKVSFAGGPSLTARGSATWNARSDLLITQPGFPEGRVVLPPTPLEGEVPTTGSTGTSETKERIDFADPNRFSMLADLYTQLLTSDQVIRQVPERPSPAQIQASPLPGHTGLPILPIIQLDTIAATQEAAQALNIHVTKALRDVVAAQQNENDIEPRKAVQIEVMRAPVSTLAAGPSHTGSILALLLCLIGTIAVTHILANLRTPRQDDDELDSVVLTWPTDEHGVEDVPPVPVVTSTGSHRAPPPPPPPPESEQRRAQFGRPPSS